MSNAFAVRILETLTREKFHRWYTEKLENYIQGDNTPSEEELIEDIKKLFPSDQNFNWQLIENQENDHMTFKEVLKFAQPAKDIFVSFQSKNREHSIFLKLDKQDLIEQLKCVYDKSQPYPTEIQILGNQMIMLLPPIS